MAPVPAPERVDAEVFHRPIESGRSKAVWLSGRGPNGLIECAVKFAASPQQPKAGYLCEWVATAIAGQFGISVPIPYEVAVSAEFADSIGSEHRTYQEWARRSVGSAFGSGKIPGAIQWSRKFPFDASFRPAAALVIGFDVFIHNYDRRLTNANLFVRRSDFIVYDHADAFAFLQPLILAPDPVVDPLLNTLPNHALTPQLKGKGVSFAAVRAGVLAITDTFLVDLRAATPSPWQTGDNKMALERIVDVLQRRRDSVDEWLPQVEAWLSKA